MMTGRQWAGASVPKSDRWLSVTHRVSGVRGVADRKLSGSPSRVGSARRGGEGEEGRWLLIDEFVWTEGMMEGRVKSAAGDGRQGCRPCGPAEEQQLVHLVSSLCPPKARGRVEGAEGMLWRELVEEDDGGGERLGVLLDLWPARGPTIDPSTWRRGGWGGFGAVDPESEGERSKAAQMIGRASTLSRYASS